MPCPVTPSLVFRSKLYKLKIPVRCAVYLYFGSFENRVSVFVYCDMNIVDKMQAFCVVSFAIYVSVAATMEQKVLYHSPF